MTKDNFEVFTDNRLIVRALHQWAMAFFISLAVVGVGVSVDAAPKNQQDDEMETIGAAACLECHSDIQKSRVGSQHGQIDCESCHEPLAKHARNPDAQVPPRVAEDICMMCHEAGMGMPASFPTIDPHNHNPGKRCSKCHPSHSPEEGKNKGSRQ